MPKKAIWARLPHLAPGGKRDIRTIFFYEQLLPDHLNRQKDNDLLANPLAASQGSTVLTDSAASTQEKNNAQISDGPKLLSLAPCLESTDAVLPAFPHVGGDEFAGLELSPVEWRAYVPHCTYPSQGLHGAPQFDKWTEWIVHDALTGNLISHRKFPIWTTLGTLLSLLYPMGRSIGQ